MSWMDDDLSGAKMAGFGCLAIVLYLLFFFLLIGGAALIVKAVFF